MKFTHAVLSRFMTIAIASASDSLSSAGTHASFFQWTRSAQPVLARPFRQRETLTRSTNAPSVLKDAKHKHGAQPAARARACRDTVLDRGRSMVVFPRWNHPILERRGRAPLWIPCGRNNRAAGYCPGANLRIAGARGGFGAGEKRNVPLL
jgi:hypothetical protein